MSASQPNNTLVLDPEKPANPIRPPSTPPHTRGRQRYPISQLSTAGPGSSRTPRRQRSTCNTFERMEDLLREAGYKETRIFTPEAERLEAEAEERERSAKEGGGVGAVVNFVRGLIPGKHHSLGGAAGEAASKVSQGEQSSELSYDTPPSPLAHKQLNRPVMPLPNHHIYLSNNGLMATNGKHRAAHLQPPAHLRHMMSTPNICDARRPSTLTATPKPVSSSSLRSRARSRRAPHPPAVPPLPPTWLETVTQSLLGGHMHTEEHFPGHLNTHRPPLLIHSKSAHASQGMVIPTLVICRSAPASRSSSSTRLPSLARTHAENDHWPPVPYPHNSHLLPSHSRSPLHPPASESDASDSDSDSELNLATLLVPAKRQSSIRSLRRHLSSCSPAHRPSVRRSWSARSSIDDAEDEEHGHTWQDAGLPGFECTGKARSKKRRAIPSAWSGWSTGGRR